MKRMKTLNIDTTVMILGAVWTVRSATETEEPRLDGVNGFTDWTTRTIYLEKNTQGNLGSIEIYMNQVIKHEVVHAFMFESGLGDAFEHKDYGQEETIVDWFAFQMGKIANVVMEIQNAVEWEDAEM